MRVDFGNDKAIEGYRDPESDDPDLVRYRPLPGEHVTTLIIPDEIQVTEAFTTAVSTLAMHMEEGASPVWVDSDNELLEVLLNDHYEIRGMERPPDWGEETEDE